MAYYYGGQNRNNRKPDNDFVSWGLIAIFFVTGLWPIGLILMIAKLVNSSGSGKGKTYTPTSNTTTARTNTAHTAAAPQTQARPQAAPARPAAQAAPPKSKAASAVASVTKTPQYGDKGSRIMQIVGAVLGIIGAIALLDDVGTVLAGVGIANLISDMFFSTGLIAGGLGLFLGGLGMKRRQRRFAKYLKAAGKKEAVPIRFLADAAEVKEPRAEKDLELMVEKGLWGPEAYVDNTNDMLFRTQAAVSEYFQKQNQPAETIRVPRQTDEGFSGMLRNIRRANDRISDPVLSAKIDRLEEVTGRIFKAIEDDPRRKEKASTFLNYYLPTTQKLLDSYADFEEAGVSGANLNQAKAKIERTMDNIVSGFEHQLDELYQADAMDVDSDIRVMESMLKRDNSSVEDDFDLNGGTAVQEWDNE